jgi:preprotein translocase subunit SecD
VKADSASILGAALLYFLTVGAVRGFAFYLGLAAILDLFAFYFFMRPATTLLVRGRLGRHPKWFGIPEPKETDEVAAGGTAPEGTA